MQHFSVLEMKKPLISFGQINNIHCTNSLDLRDSHCTQPRMSAMYNKAKYFVTKVNKEDPRVFKPQYTVSVGNKLNTSTTDFSGENKFRSSV